MPWGPELQTGRFIRTLMYSNGCKAEIHDMSGLLGQPLHSGADISSALHSHEICFRAELSRLLIV